MNFKRGLLIVLFLFVLSTAALAAEKGPFVDRVYFDVRMQEDIGIQDVAAGKSDVFYHGVDGPYIQGLDRATLDKLEIYAIPSGSWSLLLNPIPNEAPGSGGCGPALCLLPEPILCGQSSSL